MKITDEMIKELEGAASTNGYWQPEKLVDYIPKIYELIKALQTKLTEQEKLLDDTIQKLSSVDGILQWMADEDADYSADELRAMAVKALIFKRNALVQYQTYKERNGK